MSPARALLAALVPLAPLGMACGCGADSDPVDVPPPPPVTRVTSFRGASTITFAGDPRPHTLEFAYQGARRARWRLGLDGEDNRVLVFRFEDHVLMLDDAELEAVELHGFDRDVQELLLELRRVLFQWPDDGLEWTEEPDGTRTASLGSGDVEPRLLATVDADGRPASAWAEVREPGVRSVLQRYRVLGWRVDRGRAWPARLALENGDGSPLWSETVTRVETPVAFKDGFYLPRGWDHLAQDGPETGSGDG